MRFAFGLTLYAALVVSVFAIAPRLAATVLELAGVIGAIRLGWWMHTYAEHAWRHR